jgi:signal transduction histidine kinase/ligand-binding sensor domain-containing protein
VEILPRPGIKALCAEGSNVIWGLSVSNEIIRFDDRKPVARFKIPGDEPMRVLLYLKDIGLMAASTANAVLLKEGKVLPISKELLSNARPDLACASKGGGSWMAEERKVVHFTGAGGLAELSRIGNSEESPQSAITALAEDHTGRLWVGTRQGAVHCLESPGEKPAWRQVTPRRLRSLGMISCLYEDSEGLLWVGTTGGYLHQVKRPLVTMWSLPLITKGSICQTICVARDGALWVGTDGAGAYRYRNETISRFGSKQGLGSDTVISILEDHWTNLWMGTFGGLFRLENGRFKPQLESVVKGKPVPVVFEDQAGNLWLGTEGNLIRKRGDEINTFPLGSDVEVSAIAESRRGELWIGTRGAGLFRYRNGEVEKLERFRHPLVQSLHCESPGVVWVGTSTRGLFRIANNQINSWSPSDGLPSSWIHSILEDSGGTLWLGSNEGIFGVTKQALMARLRSKESPLFTIHVASPELGNWSAASGQPSAAKSQDGRIWFPVAHGVLSFNPAELIRSRPALPVLIEEVLVEGVKRDFDPVAPKLKIYAGVKRLEFRYTIADLDSPGRLKFRYKLEGLDEKWVDAGAQRFASYPSLPPGQYRFRVISAGSADVWTETANPLVIEIVPHFTQTAWFKTLVSAVVLGMVGTMAHLIGRAKLRRRLERLEMQQTMEKERQRIARDLHDDVGAGITEIMLLSELAKRGNNEEPVATGEMNSQLNGITQKARQVATAMDEIVWTVDPKNDSLADLASYLCDYAREFLRAGNVSYRIDMAEELPAVAVSAQQRHNLFMAVKEALNNAVKHSGASEVWLRIVWANHSTALCVTVEDNGRGFDAAAACKDESGNGLTNMRARLRAMGGETEFVSSAGAGAEVRFTIPLSAQRVTAPVESLN